VKWFDGIGELRIDWGPGYRVYLLQVEDTLILLLGGGTKKRQSADIVTAKRLRDEFKNERAHRTF
jgi:putative addiction module killer protein